MFRLWVRNAQRRSTEFDAFSAGLGLDPASLTVLGVGWTGREWSFPMFNANRECIGIRLRRARRGLPDAKYSVRGGREGLFLPVSAALGGPILMVEGPTDASAVLQLGFDVAGRPSCRGGEQHALDVAHGRDVVVVADRDKPGIEGAKHLASRLCLAAAKVRLLVPPAPYKDVRDWTTQARVDHRQMVTIIDALPVQALEVVWS
jgi:hypothetical protein